MQNWCPNIFMPPIFLVVKEILQYLPTNQNIPFFCWLVYYQKQTVWWYGFSSTGATKNHPIALTLLHLLAMEWTHTHPTKLINCFYSEATLHPKCFKSVTLKGPSISQIVLPYSCFCPSTVIPRTLFLENVWRKWVGGGSTGTEDTFMGLWAPEHSSWFECCGSWSIHVWNLQCLWK